jgi:hypothetical protein
MAVFNFVDQKLASANPFENCQHFVSLLIDAILDSECRW